MEGGGVMTYSVDDIAVWRRGLQSGQKAWLAKGDFVWHGEYDPNDSAEPFPSRDAAFQSAFGADITVEPTVCLGPARVHQKKPGFLQLWARKIRRMLAIPYFRVSLLDATEIDRVSLLLVETTEHSFAVIDFVPSHFTGVWLVSCFWHCKSYTEPKAAFRFGMTYGDATGKRRVVVSVFKWNLAP